MENLFWIGFVGALVAVIVHFLPLGHHDDAERTPTGGDSTETAGGDAEPTTPRA